MVLDNIIQYKRTGVETKYDGSVLISNRLVSFLHEEAESVLIFFFG